MTFDWMVATHADGFELARLITRFFIGSCFIVHALGKLGWVGKGSMQGFEAWLTALKVPFPRLQARLAMSTELVGGLCLILGLMMRPACALLFFVMLVAGLVGHRGAGYLITNNPPGNEYTVNLAAIVTVLALLGPGRYSLDAQWFGSDLSTSISVDAPAVCAPPLAPNP